MKDKSQISPPRWADWFLRWYCREEYLEEIQGDVYELFEVRREAKGSGSARLLFVWDVLRFFKWSNLKRTKRSIINSNLMLRNYLKIGWRGLLRERLYSLINLIGLTVAITVAMLIVLYVKDEASFDNYHQDGDRIYRVASNLTTPGNYFEFALTPPHLGQRMQEDFGGIESHMRLAYFSATVDYEDKSFEETSSLYADPEFFNFFSIPLVQGNADKALAAPYSVVLTEETARKYFGGEGAMGKLLQVEGLKQPLVVTGVMEEVPVNTHFDTDLLVSMSTRVSEEIIRPGQWFYLDYYTYLKLAPDVDVAQISLKMDQFIEKHIGDAQRSANQTYQFDFQNVKDIHLKSHRDVELAVNGHIQYLYIFSTVAIAILLIASVNFMNLSTARATRKSKEVGVRKVVGAVRGQLVSQFLVESSLITFMAGILSLCLVYLVLPPFNQLIDKQLSFELLFSGTMPVYWLVLLVSLAMLAGFYPALFLSRFKPVAALRSAKVVEGNGGWLRRGLVVFQLMISTALIIGVLVINRQLGGIQGKDLGFDKENIVLIDYASGPEMAKILRAELSKEPAVKQVSFSRFSPREGAINWFTQYEKEPGQLENASMYGALVDYEFIETYNLELLAGRTFDKSQAMDADSAYVLNEAAVRKIGYESNQAALGQLIGQNGNLGRVIGVVKDFNFRSLHHEIEPMVMYISDPRFYSYISVKTHKGQGLAVMEALEKVWRNVNPDKPFEAAYLNDRLNQYYEGELLTRQIFDIFSKLAIFIAALGLFALSSFIAARQQKAVCVHKVLGAPMAKLSLRFIWQFIKLALIAFAISLPAAWFLADKWLENFTYRTELDLGLIALTSLVMLLITLISVSFQSLRISRANPATILRSE